MLKVGYMQVEASTARLPRDNSLSGWLQPYIHFVLRDEPSYVQNWNCCGFESFRNLSPAQSGRITWSYERLWNGGNRIITLCAEKNWIMHGSGQKLLGQRCLAFIGQKLDSLLKNMGSGCQIFLYHVKYMRGTVQACFMPMNQQRIHDRLHHTHSLHYNLSS